MLHLDHPPPCPPSCDHCLAFDNVTRAICTQAPSPRSKWCTVHEELQAKLLKTYKRYSLAVDSFDDSSLPKNIEAIFVEHDLNKLRHWSETCRQKWSLVRRVIVARAEHHQQFYAGGDWGHCLFVETLKNESIRMERFLRALDRQAYAVTLAKSSASWVLAAPRGPSFVCEDKPTKSAPQDSEKSSISGLLTPPPTPPLANRTLPNDQPSGSTTPSLNKNQRKAARRKAARSSIVAASFDDVFLTNSNPSPPTTGPDFVLRLRSYLTFPSDLPSSVRPETWRAVVSNLFRHVILRIPSLATLALRTDERPESASCVENLDSIESFLDLLDSRLASVGTRELEKLWQGLKFARSSTSSDDSGEEADQNESNGLLGVGVLAEAFANLFRPNEHMADANAVAILGGSVWKDGYKGDWSREAWDLFYQFVACPGCVLVGTHSIETWTRNRRLAALGHYPAWMSPSEALSGTADKIFRLSGIILCSSNSSQSGQKVKRVESKEKAPKGRGSKGKKVVFVEEWERPWLYVKLPVDDPRSELLLDNLAALPSRFAVLARKTREAEKLTHTPNEPRDSCSTGRSCSCCSPSDLWLNKVRSGLSPIERKAARWSTTSYFPVETILSSLLRSSSPETRFHPEPYTDSFDCLILDSSPYASQTQGDWTTFADSVAQGVLTAQGFDTPSELTRHERTRAIERGEMDHGEWERMCVAATPEEGGKGKNGRKVVYVCEEELTARSMFREE